MERSQAMAYHPHVRHELSRLIRAPLFSSILLLWALLAVSQAAVTSAITGDGTLGTTVAQSGTIYDITGGTRPGNGRNLFHSFDRFSVGTGDTARFSGPTGIANILSRITGGQPSEIDGRLQSTIEGANLYLLNPSGVLFGPNASLAVSGSFHVSTADFLRLADGATFYANLGQESRLTVAAPAAFGFLGSDPAPITTRGNVLLVPTGRALSVVAGDITLAGGILQAASGRIQLASVASPGEVIFSSLELAPDLRVEGVARLGLITLSQGANVTVSSPAGVAASSRPGAGTVLIRGGRLLVNNAFVNARTTGAGEGARLGIDMRMAEELVLTNGGQLIAQSSGAGRAGDVLVTAGGSIAIVGRSGNNRSGLFSSTLAGGDAGRITVSTPTLTMDEGLIQALAESNSRGNAGNIEVYVDRLTLTNLAQISSDARSVGRGGIVTVRASDTIIIAGRNREDIRFASGLFSNADASGDAGRVFVSAPTLRLEDGGRIFAFTLGDGRAGDIELQVGRLTLTGGGEISSGTSGAGRGGTVTVSATDTITIAGSFNEAVPSGLVSDTTGSGPGGSVHIAANYLQLSEGGRISAFSRGAGDAGTIRLQVSDTFQSAGGHVTTEAASAGGGAIELRAGRLVQLLNSELTTSVQGGGGDAGNITIDPQFVILEGSKIIANAFEGKGGNIRIEAGVFLADPNSLVDASSTLGIQGTVDIRAPLTNLSGALAPLPQAFVSVAELLPARCTARLGGGTYSSLVVGGREGLPPDPGGLLPSPLTLDIEVKADPGGTGGPHRQNPTSRFALLAIDDKVFPRVKVSNANGSLQTASELGCTKLLGERKADLKKSR
jgi:filamentous hemagglutinin family protein